MTGGFIGIALASIAAFALLIVLGSTIDTTNAACHALNAVNGEITGYFHVQLARLGLPGTPGYTYYHAHPDQLAAARTSYVQLLSTFKPVAC